MSAVTWDEAALAGSVGRRPLRRHLSLVPSPAGADGSGTTVGADLSGGLQLTRRGRLAVTVVVLALVALAALVGVRSALAAPAPVAAVPASTVTVAAGDTLSQIAARELPGVVDGVARIQIANNLSGTAISAGARLTIPAH